MENRTELIEVAQRQLNSAFRKFDSDNSGQLQKSEFFSFLRRITNVFGAEQPSNDQIEDIWKQIDINGDGKLSKVQFDSLIVDIVEVLFEDNSIGKKISQGEVALSV